MKPTLEDLPRFTEKVCISLSSERLFPRWSEIGVLHWNVRVPRAEDCLQYVEGLLIGRDQVKLQIPQHRALAEVETRWGVRGIPYGKGR